MDAYASSDATLTARIEDGTSATPLTKADVVEDPQSPSERTTSSLMRQAFGVQLSAEQVSPGLVRRVMMTRGFPEGVPDWVFVNLAAYVNEPGRPPGPSASVSEYPQTSHTNRS
jgi:hypothetical protein